MAPIVEMAEARWHGGHMRHIPVSTAALMLMLSSGCGDDDAVPDAALDSAIDVASEGGSTDISEDVSGDTEVAIDGGEDGGLADAGVDVEMPLPIVCTEVVADQCELDDALPELAAGDTLCLADGSWPDLHIDFVGEGTMYEPITIAAEHAGMATASGSVSIRIGGSDVVVHGLVIDGATPDGEDLIDPVAIVEQAQAVHGRGALAQVLGLVAIIAH